jgi:hypothetical protein
MRNIWYPTKKAEYVTTARLQQLGLSKSDIGERDPMFGMQVEVEEEIVEDAVEAVAGLPYGGASHKQASAHGVEIEHVAVSVTQVANPPLARFISGEQLLTRCVLNSPTAHSNSSPTWSPPPSSSSDY